MEESEIKGKITITIQSKQRTTEELEHRMHYAFDNVLKYTKEDTEVFIVPSDDYPHKG